MRYGKVWTHTHRSVTTLKELMLGQTDLYLQVSTMMYNHIEASQSVSRILEQLATKRGAIEAPKSFEFLEAMSFSDVAILTDSRRDDEKALANVLAYLCAGG